MYSKFVRLTIIRSLTCTIPETLPFQCKKTEAKWQWSNLQRSSFHTTQRLRYPASFGLCVGSILCGRFLRKWWLRRTPTQQQEYLRWYRQRKDVFHGFLGFLSFILIVYCLTSFERDPVKRKPRLVLYDQATRIEKAKQFYNWIVVSQENVLPLNDPLYKVTDKAIQRLIDANKQLFADTDWPVTIIYRMFNIASYPNVLILADRSIIIIYDMFHFIKSNDQLTFILAHEMSHEMLLHNIQTLSVGKVCDFIIPVVSFLIWLLNPHRAAAMLSSVLYIFTGAVFARYKRAKEIEADDVALELSAKSCIDPREVLVFWDIMKTFEEMNEWTSLQMSLFRQHPSIEEREKRTKQQMLKAMKLRMQANCPPLPEKDPRDNLPRFRREIQKHLEKVRAFWGYDV